MTDKPAVIYMGGLQMTGDWLGRGPKAEFLRAQCESAGVKFIPLDWQSKQDGTMGQWVDTTRHSLHKLHVNNELQKPSVLVASSIGVWVALAALAHMGAGAEQYVQHLVAVGPVIDATLPLAKHFDSAPDLKIPVPCGDNVQPFLLSKHHVDDAAWYLITPGTSNTLSRISLKIGATFLAGADDMGNAQYLAGFFNALRDCRTRPTPLNAGHYANDDDDNSMIWRAIIDAQKTRSA